jgi:hypothetical protein
MRARLIITLSVAGLFAGGVAARAADPPAVYNNPSATYSDPAEAVIIYDDNPGVTKRAYWQEPWASRHYFPATGRMPLSGRREDAFQRHAYYPPAPDFYRVWSSLPPFQENPPTTLRTEQSVQLQGEVAPTVNDDPQRRRFNRHRLGHPHGTKH